MIILRATRRLESPRDGRKRPPWDHFQQNSGIYQEDERNLEAI